MKISKLKQKEKSNISEYINQEILNPLIFDKTTIKPKVKNVLIKIAEYFWKELKMPYPYEDIILLGSSANYNWTQYSDIDLHILVDLNKYSDPDLVKKYFNEAKNNWNKNHKLKINNSSIELYIQDINEPNASQGIYSLLKDKWIELPTYEKVEIPDSEINKKADPYKKEIDGLINNPDLEKIKKLAQHLKNLRKTGLEKEGEYSIENLAFKELRNSGYIEKLLTLKNKIVDQELLSPINEQTSLKKKRDRCLRIADRKYDKPSAYKSGAVVKCRKGMIWKGLKEEGSLVPAKIHKTPKGQFLQNIDIKLQQLIREKTKETLHKWFARKGAPGKKGGWVDCNTCREVDGKTKCKACGREKGEKRSKYPSCRPTPAQCKTPGKGKKWGKTK
jgi:hypothetical protein